MRVPKEERNRFIERLFDRANDMIIDYTWEKWKLLWDMCNIWNNTHDIRDEIFMSEIYNDSDDIIGIGIEDDILYFKEG